MLRAQSELLSSVVLITLTIILGIAGFSLASSWAFSMISENSFTTYAELSSNEFFVFPISFVNRGSSIVAYTSIMRIGVLQGSISIAVSIYYTSSSTQTQSWWSLNSLSQSNITYNVSTIPTGTFNLSFTPAPSPTNIASSNAYSKFSGSWWSLKDLGAPNSITIYSLGILSQGSILTLNITAPPSTKYIYIVLWVGWGDRYIAIPTLFSVS